MDRLIEMRRLEALSDTVFGVAMTFLAYRLPLSAPPSPAPHWAALLSLMGTHLGALLLGFSSAGLFWMSHHKRLAISPRPTTAEIFLNFGFLLLISVLPVTTDLLGNYGAQADVILIYASHLAALALLNLLLWCLTVRAVRRADGGTLSWRIVIGSGYSSAVFVLTALVAIRQPDVAELMLFSAFLAPLVGRMATPARKPVALSP